MLPSVFKINSQTLPLLPTLKLDLGSGSITFTASRHGCLESLEKAFKHNFQLKLPVEINKSRMELTVKQPAGRSDEKQLEEMIGFLAKLTTNDRGCIDIRKALKSPTMKTYARHIDAQIMKQTSSEFAKEELIRSSS